MSINESLVDFKLLNVVGGFLIVLIDGPFNETKQRNIVSYWLLMSYKRFFPHTRRFFKLNEF